MELRGGGESLDWGAGAKNGDGVENWEYGDQQQHTIKLSKLDPSSYKPVTLCSNTIE